MATVVPHPAAVRDAGAVVRAAQEKLQRAQQIANLQNDPLGAVLDAQIATLDAQHALLTGVGQQIEAARTPLREDVLRQAIGSALLAHAGIMVRSLSWGVRLAATGILLAGVVISGGAGYWFGRSTEAARYVQTPADLGVALTRSDAAQWVTLMRLNDISRSERTCGTQAGGLACSISLWVKPPTATSQR